MPQQELQCPFCEQTSSRPQGLAAHIRSRHPKQYPKWLKTPSRLADAQNSAAPLKGANPAQERPAVTHAENGTEALAAPAAANPALALLKQAHAELASAN